MWADVWIYYSFQNNSSCNTFPIPSLDRRIEDALEGQKVQILDQGADSVSTIYVLDSSYIACPKRESSQLDIEDLYIGFCLAFNL